MPSNAIFPTQSAARRSRTSRRPVVRETIALLSRENPDFGPTRTAEVSPKARNADAPPPVPPTRTRSVRISRASSMNGSPGNGAAGRVGARVRREGDIDPSVLARLRAGDVGALEVCWREYGGRVFRVCRALLSQDSDAEDATQEVFLKLFERTHQFADRARFSTWLHRMTVNHCLNRIEKEGRRRARPNEIEEAVRNGHEPEEPLDRAPSPVEMAEEKEAQSRLDRLLERVPAEQRAVLVLRELEGLSYAEIAETLSIPEGTVMSRLARARERITTLARTAPHGSTDHRERALPMPRRAT